MIDLIQNLVNGLSLGATYALLALGVALLFNIMGLINFAHGEVMTLGAYVLLYAQTSGLPFVPGVVLAVMSTALAAVLLERIAFRPLRGARAETLMVTSFAISIIIQIAYQNVIAARAKPVQIPDFFSTSASIGSIRIGALQIVTLAVTVLLLVLLSLFLRKTVTGLAMRAAAVDFPTTRLMGVRANRVFAVAFAISGALAGVASILWVSQRTQVDPLMGQSPLLQALVAAILGGLGTLSGPVVGGLLLGVLTVTGQAYLPAALLPYNSAIVITVVVLILAVRPSGLIAPASTGAAAQPFWRLFLPTGAARSGKADPRASES